MVAKINRGVSLYGAIVYNQQKVDDATARIIYENRMITDVTGNPEQVMRQTIWAFENYLLANKNTEKPVLHISLNPSLDDRLTDSQFADLAKEYMQKMGYGDQPYIVFKHKDISREHLHIVSLRVDEQGRKINDSHEYDQSMSVLRELERKYDLHPSVKGHELTDREGLQKVNYSEGNVKQQISSVVRSCLRNYKCSSYGEFRTLLERFNVSVEERMGTIDGRDYAGVIYGP